MQVRSISYSSDKTLARCEQQYHYKYEEGLRRRVKKEGLYRGDWLHQIYEAFYKGKDWVKAFKSIKRKLWSKLFDEEKEMYGIDFPELTYNLAEHYFDYWSKEHENWEILFVEKRFEIKTKLGPPIRFQIDLLVRERDTGKICLVETKNKKTIPTSEERILQPQVHAYAFLLKKVGYKVDKIIWNYVRTNPVPRPRINKDGSLSIREINTDQRHYLMSLREAGITPKDESETVALQQKLDSLPDTLCLERVTNSVNLKLGEKWVRDWVERARRAQGIKTPLRSWAWDCKTSCDYYLLCQCDMLGRDRKSILATDFVTKIESAKEEELK